MKKLLPFLLTVLLAAGLSTLVVLHYSNPAQATRTTETAYERVMRTGTLRCGYFEEPPFTLIDPNSGKKSGIAVDLVEKAASELGLKVEWVSGFTFGTITEDIRNNRFDAVCASLFTLPRTGKMDSTIPYAYVPVYAYTQEGRTEFDDKLDQLDWSKVSIAGIDGEGSTTVAHHKFPNAKFVILSHNAQISEMLTSVANKKADMAFVMPTIFKNFDLNNPHMLRKIVTKEPIYVFNVGFGIKPGEMALKNMLDMEFRNLIADGFLVSLFKKYDPDGLLFRPAPLYVAADQK